MIPRPQAGEYAPFYETYTSKVPDGDVVEYLVEQRERFAAELRGFAETETERGYAPGKWTLKEALGHVNDTERIFAYRCLRIARGDEKAMEGFDQDPYVAEAKANGYRWTELIAEFEAVRTATIAMVRMLRPEWWERVGTASGNPVSVRAMVYILAGHVEHHRRLLEEYR